MKINILYVITKNNEIIFIQNFPQENIKEAKKVLQLQYEDIKENSVVKKIMYDNNITNLQYIAGKKIEFDNQEEHHRIEIIESEVK